jgi:hypothetical protein
MQIITPKEAQFVNAALVCAEQLVLGPSLVLVELVLYETVVPVTLPVPDTST